MKKNTMVTLKLSEEELEEIDIAVMLLSTTRSQFIRNAALQEARKQIRDEQDKGIIDPKFIKAVRRLKERLTG